MSDASIRAVAVRFRNRCIEFDKSEDGMMVWGLLVSIMFFLLLTALAYNTGKTVAVKVDTQNTADSMAYSSAVWSARGMNTVTATNHLIGELNALYVLHHALGGRHLDVSDSKNKDTWEMNLMNLALKYKFNLDGYVPIWPDVGPPLDWLGPTILSQARSPSRQHFNVVKADTYADRNSTLFQAKLVLKAWMLKTYIDHHYGILLGASIWPPTVNAGKAMAAGAYAQETAIVAQYRFLNAVEELARSLRGIKKQIPGLIELLHDYQKALISPVGIPTTSYRAAQHIAEHHGQSGTVIARGPMPFLTLPLELEKESLSTEEKSQLIRATYPWVVHWRKPVGVVLTAGAPQSFASSFYANWSERYTLQSCEWMRTADDQKYRNQLTITNKAGGPLAGAVGSALSDLLSFVQGANLGGGGSGGSTDGEDGLQIRLPVVEGLNDTPGGVSKGREAWNDWNDRKTASRELDDLFCVMGYARSRVPGVASQAFFRQENPQGVVCFAQAMIYNANDKRSLRHSGQPKFTWDTLNWKGAVPEFKNRGFWDISWSAFSQMFQSWRQPEVRLNWQAKLTPVTNHKLLRTSLPASLLDSKLRDTLVAGREGFVLVSH